MSAFDDLCGLAREQTILSTTGAVLGWDQETGLPPGAVPYRARQLAYISGKAHSLATSDRWRRALEAAEGESPEDPVRAANLREFRHQFGRATKLPQELVERSSEASSLAKAAWVDARRESHFPTFAPHLETLLEIAREKADRWGYLDEPYDALLEGYERGARTADVASLFGQLREPLSEIAGAAVERSMERSARPIKGDFPVARQKILNREVAESLGFDFECGRIDTVTHPFCTHLGPHDTRLTTRYDENDFTSSLFGVMHEAGHGLYDQGLEDSEHGLPSGAAVSLGIHESQSRLWENHVGRSRPFWERWLPRAAELFPCLGDRGIDDFLRDINRAEFSCIRVEADEATYDLHILLRFSIERRMVRGELPVEDVPAAWNAEFGGLFGFEPPDDAHGCLQDIHWSMGGLGYFATYSLGNLNAAQLFASAMKDESVACGFARADYLPLLDWMRTRVHRRGSTLLPPDLMQAATGEATNAGFHLRHLRERFLSA